MKRQININRFAFVGEKLLYEKKPKKNPSVYKYVTKDKSYMHAHIYKQIPGLGL